MEPIGTQSGQNRPDYFVDIFLTKAFLSKIFEGEMFIRILPTTVLQIFCENLLYFQVIFKSMKKNTILYWGTLSVNGLNHDCFFLLAILFLDYFVPNQ